MTERARTPVAAATRRPGGLSLPSVLMIATVAVIVAFAMAALTTSHLHIARQHASAQDALYLAEAALAQAMGEIHKDATFGSRADKEVRVCPDTSPDRREGVVTFLRSGADPFSTNNFDGRNAVGYGGAQVSNGTAHLVATGRSQGVARTVEAVVHKPDFPYVLAVAGPLESSGRLEVRGAANVRTFVAQEGAGGAPSTPASVASNKSVRVTEKCVITGDVVSAGTIELKEGSTVGGVIRTGTVDLPDIDATKWNPAGKAGTHPPLRPTYEGGLTELRGRYLTTGDLTVNGHLSLDRGLLFVNGNLTVQGGLRGNGVIVVRGTTTVTGGADLAAENLVALICEGNVTLTGTTGSRKYFQGLVYSRGTFEASDITIAGTFITALPRGAGPSFTPPGIRLRDVRVVHLPEAGAMKVQLGAIPSASDLMPPWTPSGISGVPWTLQNDGYVGGIADTPSSPYRDDILEILRAVRDDWPPAVPFDLSYIGYGSAVTRQFSRSNTSFFSIVYLPSGPGQVSACDHLCLCVFSLRLTKGRFERVTPLVYYIRGWTPISRTEADELARAGGTTVDAMLQATLAAQRRAGEKANEILDRYVSGEGPAINTVDLSLDQFLRDTFPLRVVSWRAR